MDSDQLVNTLLDEWELLLETNPKSSLSEFVASVSDQTPETVLAKFSDHARKLQSFNKLLELGQSQAIAPAKSDAMSMLQPGLKPVPGYVLVEKLGAGGFGEVWKAKSPGGFDVAMKFVPSGGREVDMEIRSLKLMKDVRHPNLLSIFGAWKVPGAIVVAMELADKTLFDRLEESLGEGLQGIPKDELVEYITEAAKGIDALNSPADPNQPPLQHRDIKPQNLLLSGGSVKVGDFGLAQSILSEVTEHTGSMTFAYAAPENFDGQTSRHSDQYSLAIAYCELRGGRLPFVGSYLDVMDGHRSRKPDLSMLPSDEQIAVSKALNKKPSDRWPSCTDFAKALRDESSSKPVSKQRSSVFKSSVAIPLFVLALGLLWFVSPTDFLSRFSRQAEESASDNALAIDSKNELLTTDQADTDNSETHATEDSPFIVTAPSQTITASSNTKVRCLAIDTDSQLLASTTATEGIVKLWNLNDFSDAGEIDTGDHVEQVAISSSGNLIATGSRYGKNRQIKIWTLNSKGHHSTTSTDQVKVNALAFSPDSRILGIAHDGERLVFWNTRSRTIKNRLTGHKGPLITVRFSPVDDLVATGGNDKLVKVWNWKTGKLIWDLKGHDDEVLSVVFSPDGSRVASCSRDASVRIWNLDTGKCRKVIKAHTRDVWSLAASPTESIFASASHDSTTKIWTWDGKLIGTFDGPSSIWSVVFGSKGEHIYTGCEDGKIRSWQIPARKH